MLPHLLDAGEKIILVQKMTNVIHMSARAIFMTKANVACTMIRKIYAANCMMIMQTISAVKLTAIISRDAMLIIMITGATKNLNKVMSVMTMHALRLTIWLIFLWVMVRQDAICDTITPKSWRMP